MGLPLLQESPIWDKLKNQQGASKNFSFLECGCALVFAVGFRKFFCCCNKTVEWILRVWQPSLSPPTMQQAGPESAEWQPEADLGLARVTTTREKGSVRNSREKWSVSIRKDGEGLWSGHIHQSYPYSFVYTVCNLLKKKKECSIQCTKTCSF